MNFRLVDILEVTFLSNIIVGEVDHLKMQTIIQTFDLRSQLVLLIIRIISLKLSISTKVQSIIIIRIKTQ